MVVDNFDLISSALEWNNKDEFYFLQIIQRKKDGNDTGRGNNGARTIKTYYIFNQDDFSRRKNKIIELCEANNARAYIHLNRRNARDCCIVAAQEYLKLIKEDNCFQGIRIWDHACGIERDHNYLKLWLLDVDSKDPDYIWRVLKVLFECRGEPKVKLHVPTLHGYHLITTGFDCGQFQQLLKIEKLNPVDIHKDNPTLLYYKEKENG